MDIYISIVRFFEQGGDVIYLIAITTFLMWTLMFERLYYFMREHRNVIRDAIEVWELGTSANHGPRTSCARS